LLPSSPFSSSFVLVFRNVFFFVNRNILTHKDKDSTKLCHVNTLLNRCCGSLFRGTA
jgi:hypothetical protein